MTRTTSSGALVVVASKSGDGRLFWEATWRHAGRSMKRRLGVAWIRPRAEVVDVKGWAGAYVKRPGSPTGDELTPQQAVVAMRDLIAAHASSAPTTGRPRTCREAAAAWLDDPHARPHAWAPSTEADYRRMLADPGDRLAKRAAQGRIMAALGDKRVDRVTAADVRKVVEAAGAGSPRTANKTLIVLRLILADAAARGWRTGNPAQEVARRRQPRAADLEVFTLAQVEAIADAAEQPWMGALIVVAATTGLRRGELVALRWRDVRIEQPALSVERAVSEGQIGPPKSGRSRVVPLADRPLEVLRGLGGGEPDALVFGREDGAMRSVDHVSHAFVTARDAAGAPALRFHDLRHTFGSRLAAGGVPITDIKEYLGHASISTTQIYMRFAPRADAAARLTAALGG